MILHSLVSLSSNFVRSADLSKLSSPSSYAGQNRRGTAENEHENGMGTGWSLAELAGGAALVLGGLFVGRGRG